MEVPDDYREQPGSAGALKLERLKQNIRGQNKYPVSEYESVISLGEKVESSIKSLVEIRLLQFALGEHQKEKIEQKTFIRSRTGVYIPDAELNTRLDQFAGSKESGLLITGDSGTGKSALLANWIQNRGTRDNEKTIYHFIGQSRSSGKLVKVMDWLREEINKAYGYRKTERYWRWGVAGVFLGLIPLIGIPVFGGPVIKFFVLRIIVGFIAGIITSLLGLVILFAHGWGLSALALLLGSIAFGKYAGHPIKIGLIGSVAGLILWRIGAFKNEDVQNRIKQGASASFKGILNIDEKAKENIKYLLQKNLLAVQKYGRLFIVLDGLDKF
jgi:hypothetical protein